MKKTVFMMTVMTALMFLFSASFSAQSDCRGCCSWHGGVICKDGKKQCEDGTALSDICGEECGKCSAILRHSSQVQAQVFFSPNGGAENAVISELDNAKSEILIQAYIFTDAEIAKALLDAKKRGVSVAVILDKSNLTAEYSSADFMKNQAIPIYIDSLHKIAHNKIMIIDRMTVITGSYNFSKAAEEKNAENLLILKNSRELAGAYVGNWEDHKLHSELYDGR
jgi:phosphatidylserine/phosphatidylglycerophosphate/cardiolipin synthase-like enzyme